VSLEGIGMEAQLAAASEDCRLKLREGALAGVLGSLGPLGQPEGAFQLLSGIAVDAESGAEVARLSASISPQAVPDAVERALLILAPLHAAEKVPSLPVGDRVKELFAEEFRFFANPPAVWANHFQAHDVRYREMARVATLRRFPAGQFQWEIAALPRSGVAKARRPWQVLARVIGRMGGFGPLFELHVNARRRNRLVLLENEANLSYYRAARAVEKQPPVRGLLLASWLFCESTARVTPRLEWLRRIPLEGGASISDLGPAPADSGFLIGSEERRRQYEEGSYRPRTGCVLWPRKALLEWAARHPEFDT
jgi:hypothetical protein